MVELIKHNELKAKPTIPEGLTGHINNMIQMAVDNGDHATSILLNAYELTDAQHKLLGSKLDKAGYKYEFKYVARDAFTYRGILGHTKHVDEAVEDWLHIDLT